MWDWILYLTGLGLVSWGVIYLMTRYEDGDIYDGKYELKWNKITRYKNCDILHHYNNVKMCGYSKKFSEEEMIGLAVLNGCRAITRTGHNGTWYLKGRDVTIQTLKQEIVVNLERHHNGAYVLLLEE